MKHAHLYSIFCLYLNLVSCFCISCKHCLSIWLVHWACFELFLFLRAFSTFFHLTFFLFHWLVCIILHFLFYLHFLCPLLFSSIMFTLSYLPLLFLFPFAFPIISAASLILFVNLLFIFPRLYLSFHKALNLFSNVLSDLIRKGFLFLFLSILKSLPILTFLWCF